MPQAPLLGNCPRFKEFKELLQLCCFFQAEDIALGTLLVRFIILCLTLFPSAGSVAHTFSPPKVAQLGNSISENGLNGKKLVLKLAVGSLSYPQCRRTECDFHEQSIVCTCLPWTLLFICTICNVFDLLFAPTLCMCCMYLRPHFKVILSVNFCVICWFWREIRQILFMFLLLAPLYHLYIHVNKPSTFNQCCLMNM